MKKSQDRWGNAHVRLKELFESRAGMSQQEFAERYGLGTQGMVWQYLSGYRPLNVEAAAKFARGLNCTIADFAPEMAKLLRREILPVLGKAASIVFFTIAALIAAPQPSQADTGASSVPAKGGDESSTNAKHAARVCVLCEILRALAAFLVRSLTIETLYYGI